MKEHAMTAHEHMINGGDDIIGVSPCYCPAAVRGWFHQGLQQMLGPPLLCCTSKTACGACRAGMPNRRGSARAAQRGTPPPLPAQRTGRTAGQGPWGSPEWPTGSWERPQSLSHCLFHFCCLLTSPRKVGSRQMGWDVAVTLWLDHSSRCVTETVAAPAAAIKSGREVHSAGRFKECANSLEGLNFSPSRIKRVYKVVQFFSLYFSFSSFSCYFFAERHTSLCRLLHLQAASRTFLFAEDTDARPVIISRC